MSAIRIAPAFAAKEWWTAAGLLVSIALLLAGGNLAGNGVFAAVQSGGILPGWEQGSLLRVLLIWMAGWFGAVLDTSTALVLIYVGLAAFAGASTYRSLRQSDWPGWMALLALVLLLAHPMLLQSITLATPEFVLMLAAGMLIPARRLLEAVGDVQSVLGYGLVLPVLLLAGPPLALLILPLVMAVPLSEREARRNGGVFLAMSVVAIIPVIIVILGVWSMTARVGIGMDYLLAPFAQAYSIDQASPVQPMILLAIGAPVGLTVILHMIVPDRRRKIMTSLLVLGVPAWVLLGNSYLSFGVQPWAPALILVGTSMGWLAATRVRPWMRWMVLGLMLVGDAASWTLAPFWSDPAWLNGLMPIHLFGGTFG